MPMMEFSGADIELIESTAAMIDGEALILRHSRASGPDHSDFGDDIGAKETHDEMKKNVVDLYALAERMRASA